MLIKNARVVTWDEPNEILEDHAVWIDFGFTYRRLPALLSWGRFSFENGSSLRLMKNRSPLDCLNSHLPFGAISD